MRCPLSSSHCTSLSLFHPNSCSIPSSHTHTWVKTSLRNLEVLSVFVVFFIWIKTHFEHFVSPLKLINVLARRDSIICSYSSISSFGKNIQVCGTLARFPQLPCILFIFFTSRSTLSFFPLPPSLSESIHLSHPDFFSQLYSLLLASRCLSLPLSFLPHHSNRRLAINSALVWPETLAELNMNDWDCSSTCLSSRADSRPRGGEQLSKYLSYGTNQKGGAY